MVSTWSTWLLISTTRRFTEMYEQLQLSVSTVDLMPAFQECIWWSHAENNTISVISARILYFTYLLDWTRVKKLSRTTKTRQVVHTWEAATRKGRWERAWRKNPLPHGCTINGLPFTVIFCLWIGIDRGLTTEYPSYTLRIRGYAVELDHPSPRFFEVCGWVDTQWTSTFNNGCRNALWSLHHSFSPLANSLCIRGSTGT